jgi:aryl-alcohol dehydrogenase-like predicted oxidoreductase
MEITNLGRCGLKVSRLCLGTMLFGGATGEEESVRIIHRALDEGINFIDTADVYTGGESERITGRAIRDRRDQVVLATKVRHPTGPGPNDAGLSRRHILAAVDESLKRLGTDYLDLYYLHSPDYETPVEESLAALNACVRQGKVRYTGCSNFYAWQVCESIWTSRTQHLASLKCIQPFYNILNRDVEVELLPMCAAYGLGVVVYSPLSRGVLAGKYLPGAPPPEESRAARGDRRIQQTELREESFVVAQQLRPLAEAHGATLTQFSLAWVLANPNVTAAIIGPRTLEQLEDNLACLGVAISAADEREVDRLNPAGEHTGIGFNDPQYPVRGRPPKPAPV